MMLFLGRGIHLPDTTHDWLLLIGVLSVIAVALIRIADIPTAALGVFAGLVSYVVDKHIYLPATIAVVATIALVTKRGHGAEHSGQRALREALYLGAGFLIYEQGRAIFVGDLQTAERNAGLVLSLERQMRLYFEPAMQRIVLDHRDWLPLINGIYSWAYLPFVFGTVFWLYLTDDRTYRLFRAALGISVLLSLTTIALFPVAPPRLIPTSDLVGTHVLLGRVHGFVNPYAAIPSFHVGWTAIAGYMLWRSLGGKIGGGLMIAPIGIMTTTVIVTGNHYWVDGLIGALYVFLPLLAIVHRDKWMAAIRRVGMRPTRWTVRSARALRAAPWGLASIATLVVLLLYLLVREAIDPGFAHYWGYMVGQIAATIAILIALETHFAEQGGLSLLTYVVVMLSTWADTLGTAAHMYDRYSGYDKIIHFGGGLAITAVAADLLFARQRRRGSHRALWPTLRFATYIAIGLNIGWEIYEYLGDRVFSTGRHAGRLDTTYDLMSDIVGALVGITLLAHIEPRRFAAVGDGGMFNHMLKAGRSVVSRGATDRPADSATAESESEMAAGNGPLHSTGDIARDACLLFGASVTGRVPRFSEKRTGGRQRPHRHCGTRQDFITRMRTAIHERSPPNRSCFREAAEKRSSCPRGSRGRRLH